MSLDHAILGFLRERPMTGYDLKNVCFDERAAHFWTADQAQVYRTLERLATRRLVTSRRERQRSRPDRKVYAITDAGVAELDEWIARSDPPPALRDPFLIRLRFAEALPDEQLLAILQQRRAQLQARLDSLRTRAAQPPQETGGERSLLLARLTLDAAAAEARSSIDWLDDTIEALEATAEQARDLPPGSQRRLFAPPQPRSGRP